MFLAISKKYLFLLCFFLWCQCLEQEPHLDKNAPTGLLHSPEKKPKCLKFKIFEIMEHKKLRKRNNVASSFHQVRVAWWWLSKTDGVGVRKADKSLFTLSLPPLHPIQCDKICWNRTCGTSVQAKDHKVLTRL